jgi:hypothetical protein
MNDPGNSLEARVRALLELEAAYDVPEIAIRSDYTDERHRFSCAAMDITPELAESWIEQRELLRRWRWTSWTRSRRG